jgi:hypothetical protein
MKRILALMFVLAAGTSVFAQGHRSDNSREGSRVIVVDNDSRNGRSYDRNYFTERERNQAVERTVREFDSRIRWVESDRRMSNRERRRAIRSLEDQKREAIRDINERYYRQNNGHNRYPSNNRRY